MNRKNIFFPIISVLLLAGCHEKEKRTDNKEAVSNVVKTDTVLSIQPEFDISLTANLNPYESTLLYPKQTGFVRRLLVDRGAKVQKGQLLAVLEAPEINQQVAAGVSNTSGLRAKWMSSKSLYERLEMAARHKGAVAPLDIDNAYAQVQADSAAYISATHATGAIRQQGNYLEIRAPFNGMITDRFVSEGALVGGNNAANNALFRIAALDKLRLTVAVPEQYSDAVGPDTKAVFMTNSIPGKTFDVHFSRMSSVLDDASRSAQTEFDYVNKDYQLKGNEFVQVKLWMKRKSPTLFVPANAVTSSQLGVYVWKINADHIVKRITVQKGILKDNLQEIFSMDMKAGDVVAAQPSEEWEDGQKVR